jgi:hypothetical protein
MDLTQQPPRRPTNTSMLGIVALARMTDKARAHEDETLGEYIYGNASGLDKRILEFLNISEEDFADSAERFNDTELCDWIQETAPNTEDEIQTHNNGLLTWKPFNEITQQRLKDRLEKYGGDPDKVKTMLQSMELDDWGCFRDTDLTQHPPRTPYNRSVAGLYGLARMADKARAAKVEKLNDYIYNCPIDEIILEFLNISAEDFQDAAYHNVNDIELSDWVRDHTDRTQGEISRFNHTISQRGPEGEHQQEIFNKTLDRVAPGRTDITAWFNLLDLDDEHDYNIVDLTRHPPRSAYDTSLLELIGLARMTDKGRASLSNSLGEYFYGKDSLLDSFILKTLGISAEDFQNALKECTTDEAVISWLQTNTGASEDDIMAFNDDFISRGPRTTAQKDWFRNRVRGLDPKRDDLATLIAMVQLDDQITFTRLKAGV